MLQTARKAIVWLWRYHSQREGAYKRFLDLLAESPTEWFVLESGAIRSSQGECPIVEAYQSTTYGRADTEDRYNVLWAAGRLGLSLHQGVLIMGAADRRTGSVKQMRVRNDLLTALEKARKRTNASKEGMLAAECRWEERPERELVGA